MMIFLSLQDVLRWIYKHGIQGNKNDITFHHAQSQQQMTFL